MLSVSEFAGTPSMTDEAFKKSIETRKKLRELLCSLLKKQKTLSSSPA